MTINFDIKKIKLIVLMSKQVKTVRIRKRSVRIVSMPLFSDERHPQTGTDRNSGKIFSSFSFILFSFAFFLLLYNNAVITMFNLFNFLLLLL